MSDPNPPNSNPNPEPAPPVNPPLPAPPTSAVPPAASGSSRSWEVACHLSALSGWITGGVGWIAGPLIVWLLKKSEMPGVDAHGKEALNFHISIFLYSIAMMLVAFLTCGLGAFLVVPLAILLGLAQIVFAVIAGIKASNGEFYRYPFTIRLVT
jgi:hypothetical protein